MPAAATVAPRRAAAARARGARRPLEYSILYTAVLCLLATGAVMVYSASSAVSALDGSGDPSLYLKRYVIFGLIGLGAFHVLSRHGLKIVRRATPALLAVSLVLVVAVMLPGVGVTVNGATRWLAAGPIQFQPSELLKLALVLYGVRLLAARPESVESVKTLLKPLLLVVGAACALLLKQPDMGTALVICFAIGTLLIAAGVPPRVLATIVLALAAIALVVALIEPYRRARLTAFLDPFADVGDTGYQAVQGLTAIGSGGLFGVGLGESVQKIFYLPEAHTDMILAIIGEEIGVMGVFGVALLYGMIGYAGLRAAKRARDRYCQLLAAGITSLILCQALLNFFAVLGLAPLTGIPLPFISYGSTNLIVLLAGMGLVLNVAATGGLAAAGGDVGLTVMEGGSGGEDRDCGRRDSRSRGAGAGRRRGAAS